MRAQPHITAADRGAYPSTERSGKLRMLWIRNERENITPTSGNVKLVAP